MSPRRARLALTTAGRQLALATLMAALAGALGPGLARPLAALGAAALLGAVLGATLPLRTLALDELRPARGAVGARVRLFLTARHRARLVVPRRLAFAILEPAAEAAVPAGSVTGALPRGDTPLELQWRPRRRGREERLRVAVTGEDALGLVRATRVLELVGERLGLPRRGRLVHEPLLGRARAPAPRGRRGRGAEELDHVRDWRAGESLRLLHWRLSARRGRPILRELAAPAEAELELVLCTAVAGLARRARRQAFERAVSLVATLAEHYLRAGRRVRLALDDGAQLDGLAGRRGLERALAWLATVEPVEGEPVEGEPARAQLEVGRRSGTARIVVLAGGGAVVGARAARVFDVDAPREHAHAAPWRDLAAPGAAW